MSTADRHVGIERARRRSAAVLEGGAPRPISPASPFGRKRCRNARSRDGQLDRSATSSIDSRRRRRASSATRSSSSGVTGSGSTSSCSIRQGIRSRIPGSPAPRRRYRGSPPSAFLCEAGVESTPARVVRAQAAWIARQVTARGIDHLHATQLATVDVVREVKRMTGVDVQLRGRGKRDLRRRPGFPDPSAPVTEAEFVVVPSEVSRQQLLAVTGPGANGNVHRIYRGVDLGTFRYGADPSMIRARCWRSVRSSRAAALPI